MSSHDLSIEEILLTNSGEFWGRHAYFAGELSMLSPISVPISHSRVALSPDLEFRGRYTYCRPHPNGTMVGPVRPMKPAMPLVQEKIAACSLPRTKSSGLAMTCFAVSLPPCLSHQPQSL